MIKLKDMISENVWDRKFGEPLPTLKDVVNKHNNITEDDCGCSGVTSCACEVVTEHTVTFTKDEMEKLHSGGKVVKADPDGKDHTYAYNESVTEGPDEKSKASREFQYMWKAEEKLRTRMIKLEQIMLRDARPENVKLAKDLKKSYKLNVTEFMREVIKLIKKLK